MHDSLTASGLEGFHWFNEPPKHSFSGRGLTMLTRGKTDFWQGTHYGFRRDNGHCFLKTISGDFSILAKASFEPKAQYDQCGLFARINAENWIKASMEYENPQFSRLGSVVTNLGFSDWASQDLSTQVPFMFYRLSRSGNDFLSEYSLDGKHWHQMRVTHLHRLEDALDVGVYACSPVGEGFRCSFDTIEIGPSIWDTPVVGVSH